MTKQEEQDIATCYANGYSYYAIAKAMQLSYSSVRKFVLDNDIARTMPKKSAKENETLRVCYCCGRIMNPEATRKGAKYCSDGCRLKHWREQKSEEDFANEPKVVIVYPPKRTAEVPEKRLAFSLRKSDELEDKED